MTKKLFIYSFVLIILFNTINFDIVNASTLPVSSGNILTNSFATDINCSGYILYELNTDKIICESNSNERIAPASITKIMSLILIYEAINNKQIDLSDNVTISEHAASMGGSQIFLEANEKMKVADLIKSIVISSANDACTAMAEYVAGTEEEFVNRMNSKCLDLGMNNTCFKNCCGLDCEGHYSSAYDIAIMADYLLSNYPEVCKFTLTWMDTITHNTSKGSSEFGLTNTNKLIKSYEGITGLKTGSTNNSGYSFCASAQRDDTYYIAVVLGAKSTKDRFRLASDLMNYGFSNYHIISVDKSYLEKNIKIKNTIDKIYTFSTNQDIKLLVPINITNDKIIIKISDKIQKADKPYLKTQIMLDKDIISEINLYSKVNISKTTLSYYIKQIINNI